MTAKEIEELAGHRQVPAWVFKLVCDAIAIEREKLAKWMMQHEYATGHGETIEDLLEELKWQIKEQWNNAAAAEREACADVAENWRCNGMPRTILAEQIRARGQE